jgi:hypothetical protein
MTPSTVDRSVNVRLRATRFGETDFALDRGLPRRSSPEASEVWFWLAIVGIILMLAGWARLIAATDVTGKWEIEATFDDTSLAGGGFDCAFKQDGVRLSGSCSAGTAPVTGEVNGSDILWRLRGAGNPPETTTFTGTVNDSDTSMKGRFTIGGKGGSFTGVKQ